MGFLMFIPQPVCVAGTAPRMALGMMLEMEGFVMIVTNETYYGKGNGDLDGE